MSKPTIAQVDALLPQTQCGLCSYQGCLPYATAIVQQGEQVDRCLPGGVATLAALGELLEVNHQPFVAEMQQKAKPPMRAVIREAECIGCTKCIQACPVDAILGAAKQMHTVIADECSGCELCVAPCPVDCIEMQPITAEKAPISQQQAQQYRQRFLARQTRLARQKQQDKLRYQHAKLSTTADQAQLTAQRKAAIAEALVRAKLKKSQ